MLRKLRLGALYIIFIALLRFSGPCLAAEPDGASSPRLYGLGGLAAGWGATLLVVALYLRCRKQRMKLERQWRWLHEVIRHSADSFTILAADGTQVFVSEAVERMLGFTPPELINTPVIDAFIHPDDREEVRAAFMKTIAQGNGHARYRHIRKDGSWADLEAWASNQINNPDIRGILINVRDITQQRQAERALCRSEANLRVTLNSIGDGVIATDNDGKITRMNTVAERLTGYTLPEAEGRPLGEVLRVFNHDTGELLPPPLSPESATHFAGIRMRLVSRAGDECHITRCAAPIQDGEGKIAGTVLTFRDVSEEYALLEQLHHSQRLDAIGRLAGGVAHDFNNMLGGIMGAADLLAQHLHGDPAAERLLNVLQSSAGRASELTEKLLAFGRRQTVCSTPFALRTAIRAAADLLSSAIDRRIQLSVNLPDEQAWVLGDATMLQNVFMNLGLNAAQAMPEGGALDFSAQRATLNAADCMALGEDLTPGSYICIDVRDSGCGIAPELMPRIFEPFFTTKPPGKGTGLGLAAALGTIRQHRGGIRVASTPGHGACFSVFLPLTVAADLKEELQPVTPRLRQRDGVSSGTILLVDDEAYMRDCGSEVLSRAGYTVLQAKDGEEAVGLFRERHSQIDLVLLDMIMPKMNGRDCFHALRAIRPDVRIIISSGFSRLEDLSELAASGMCGFIRKPYRAQELKQTVAAILDGSAPSIASAATSA